MTGRDPQSRASRSVDPVSLPTRRGLAPWQLRRAKEMFRADLSANLSLQRVAEACKLSVSHFSRAFKVSTGVPPHKWLLTARIERARGILADSATPLVEGVSIHNSMDAEPMSRQDVAAVVRAVST